MRLIEKIKNIKVNSKIVIGLIILIIIGVIGYGINYCFYSPSSINKYIASNLYKSPANNAFDDDKFYRCVVEAYNSKNKTNLPYTSNLSDIQLQTITSLSCDRKGIESAKGVEKLTLLTSLDVSWNQLTSLDVSENTSLTKLSAHYNQLESLDVSNNPALTHLNVGANQLTSLDVSKNTILKELYVYDNQLTNLDVSNNRALTDLSAPDNQLTNLDVSVVTSLRELKLSSNQLTSLDVSNNIILTSLDVSNYIISKNRNQLTSLDVSNNTKLTYLGTRNNQLTSLDVSNNPALTELIVDDNRLTSLDVSNNIALIKLDVSSNQLTSLDVSNNTNLTYLGVWNNQLTSLDVSGATALTELDAHRNQLTSLDVSQNTALTSLSMFNNRLIGLNVSNNIILTSLDVSNYDNYENRNQLTSLDVSNNTKLTYLGTRNNQLTILGVSKNTKLTYLDARNNQLTSLDVSNNPALTELIVDDNRLTSLDVSNNIALIKLDVSSNQLIGLDVSNNTALTELIVDDNRLTSLDVSNNTVLTELYARQNQLASLDVSNNKTLSVLAVGENQLISLDVSNNTVLKSLDASSNQLISLDVSNNTALKSLDASSNQLTSLDVSNNIALTYLSAMKNQFNDNLTSVFVGENVNIDNLKKIVKLPSHFVPTIKTIHSNGLEVRSDGVFATKAGKQSYVVKNNLGYSGYDETYYVEVVGDLKSDKYTINGRDYVYLGIDKYINVLDNIFVENGELELDANNKLVIKSGDTKMGTIDLLRLNSINDQYKIGDDYIYVLNDSDEDILSKVQFLNGNDIVENSVNIDGDNLIIKYNDVVLDDLKIIRSTINKYRVEEMSNFVYLRTDDYNDLKENVKVDNGKVIVDEETGHLRIMYNDNQVHKYEIFKFSVLNDSYILTDKYIFVGSDRYEDVLENIKFIRSGQEYPDGIKIKDGYLQLSAGVIDFEKLKIIRISSSVYDLSKDYIYVGTDTDKEIVNNIETTANITIENNVLNIFYAGGYEVSYKLIRLDTKYNISKGYIYTWDSNYLDNINVINGSKEIIDNNLIIKYNDLELDRIPILNLYSDVYIIKGDYIYTGLGDIDLSKITTSNDLELSKNINRVILTYKGEIIDEVPYYYLGSNSDYIRFSARENKIYVTNKMMIYRDFLSYISFNYGNESITLYDKNGKVITNEDDEYNYLVETGSYIVIKHLSNVKYYIEVDTNKVEYSYDADVYYTEQYRKDILKNLSINNTFGNVKNLIITSGTIRNVDKDENFTDDTSTIKTGDKFAVVFPTGFNYYIYLSVKGDVTGKGNISNEDVLESYSILRGSIVEDYYRLASDINNDGEVKINDVAKLYQYVNNKIEGLD